MIRNIVHIDEEKCNGCGLCVNACLEGAIELIDGKAKLVSDEYCDGLGNCLPECPTHAISIIQRESKAFDEEAANNKIAAKKNQNLACGCPGTAEQKIERDINTTAANTADKYEKNNENINFNLNSHLNQWPVQIKLVNPDASFFNDCNLLVAADCTAYAYGNFHNEFIKDHVTVIGCPKLDDNNYYKTKLTEILRKNNLKSITVVRMEVPCCSGIVSAVKSAMLEAQVIVPYKEVTVSIKGALR